MNEDDNNSSRVFIDVFNNARLLSYSDCVGIVLQQYGILFHPSMITPLTNEQVWQRMVANLLHCHSNCLSMFTDDSLFQEFLPLFNLPEYSGKVGIKNFQELVSRVGILCHQID